MLADPVLVLVDYQKDFCKPGFAISEKSDVDHVQPALERTGALLDRYRKSSRTPVVVRTELPTDVVQDHWAAKLEDRGISRICAPGSAGSEFVPEIDVQDDDIVITKRRYSAFYGTDLDLVLSNNGIEELLVCGVSTNACVESTVRAAYDRDYRVTVIGDCTAAASRPDLHEPSLEGIDAFFGDVVQAPTLSFDPVD